MTQQLTHIDAEGDARMVDVSEKAETKRTAIAEGFVAMQPETLAVIESGSAKKGDVLAAARIAGIMAAKQTSNLIPLCHPLALTKVEVKCAPQHAEKREDGRCGIRLTATCSLVGKADRAEQDAGKGFAAEWTRCPRPAPPPRARIAPAHRAAACP